MRVDNLLKKYNLLDDSIKRIDYHMGVLSEDADDLVLKILNQKEVPEAELAVTIYTLILRCDSNNPEYSSILDEEMTRFGLKTDKFDTKPHSKWHYGTLYSDSDPGVSEMYTDMYDDYQDFQSDVEHYKINK